jgi:cell shape-determining protein MreC
VKQQMRAQGRRVANKVAPGMVQSVEDLGNLRRAVRDTRRQLNRLRARVVELENEVQENRRLNRRLAELTDVVQELLVPIAQRDDKRLQELLDKYSETL